MSEKRVGLWELNYTNDEKPICEASGAAWLYGRVPRHEDKPLAIVYADEIVVPAGIHVEIINDLGATRLKFFDVETRAEIEAMAMAAQDKADDEKAWARVEADAIIANMRAEKATLLASGMISDVTFRLCGNCDFVLPANAWEAKKCPNCGASKII